MSIYTFYMLSRNISIDYSPKNIVYSSMKELWEGDISMDKQKKLVVDGIRPFELVCNYVECYYDEAEMSNKAHIHDACEIYINLSGDVSFIVEDRVYLVNPGNAIITRPNEYHHCIYHSDALHKHFCIFFTCWGNEGILTEFFQRILGEKNLVVLEEEQSRLLNKLCFDLMEKDLNQMSGLLTFLKIINLLDCGREESETTLPEKLPTDVEGALEYINANIASELSVAAIAKAVSVSVNTLERHFKASLQVSPTELIKRKRLYRAAELLRSGCSVQEAAMESGFCDSSYFIGLFRERFSMTPLKYKKKYSTDADEAL